MKKLLILSCITAAFYTASAQVGINTQTPDASAALDITSTEKGLLIPRVVLDNITAELTTGVTNAESLMVYNTGSASLVKGFYTWMDSKWVKLGSEVASSEPKFNYMPSIALPVGAGDTLLSDPSGNYAYATGTKTFTVKIYELFKKQFQTPVKKSDANASLNTFVKNPTEYKYFVTYADEKLFTDINISETGELTYKIDETAIIRTNSFMNIVVSY